jgi:hypothetical protein
MASSRSAMAVGKLVSRFFELREPAQLAIEVSAPS